MAAINASTSPPTAHGSRSVERARSVARLLVAAICTALGGHLAAAAEVPLAPEDGGPRHFEVTGVASFLNLREAASAGAAIAGRLEPGAVLSNLGCQQAEGRVWCYVQPFEGGPVGFVDASYLSPAVAPDGAVATGPNDAPLRAGQGEFDATGTIPCAQGAGAPMTQCGFGVARAGGGDAAVVVTKPDGIERVVFFTRGIAMGTDSSEADPASFDFSASKQSDLHLIRVGEERYEIPDAVVFGG